MEHIGSHRTQCSDNVQVSVTHWMKRKCNGTDTPQTVARTTMPFTVQCFVSFSLCPIADHIQFYAHFSFTECVFSAQRTTTIRRAQRSAGHAMINSDTTRVARKAIKSVCRDGRESIVKKVKSFTVRAQPSVLHKFANRHFLLKWI